MKCNRYDAQPDLELANGPVFSFGREPVLCDYRAIDVEALCADRGWWRGEGRRGMLFTCAVLLTAWTIVTAETP